MESLDTYDAGESSSTTAAASTTQKLISRWEKQLKSLAEKHAPSNEQSCDHIALRPQAFADGGPLQIDPSEPNTLTKALLRSAQQSAGKGIRVIDATGAETFCTYSELLCEARQVLSGLQAAGMQPGDRVILQVESLRDHFAAFWGCVLGGIRPVTVAIPPAYVPDNAVVKKLHNVWQLLRAPSVIASGHLIEPIQSVADKLEMNGLRVLAVSELKKFPPAEAIYDASPEDVVFYQLTSGSTGVPKCIQETHWGIITHIHAGKIFNGYSADDVTLNWLPMDHVVPILTFHLRDTYLGCQQVAVKTDYILANPLRWLELMHRYRVTQTWSPNFGFKLVSDALAGAKEKNWDLSCVKFFMNAGEQVTVPVVEDFLNAVKKFGVRESAMQPAFGMAEVCTCMTYENNFSLAAGARRFLKSSLGATLQETGEKNAASIEFVGLGPPVPGVQIRIANQNNQTVCEGVIGRFQIKGDVVTPGYLYNDEANRDAFVGDGWFNSGDIGFILDGKLFLTGREKEMIIVRGANFYCYEIEDIVNRVEGVEPTFSAACAVEDASTGTEGLAVFFVPKEGVDGGKLAPTIRARVAASMGIAPSVVIPLAKKEFPKTTSGKIQRAHLKKALHAGEFRERLGQTRQTAGARKETSPLEQQIIAIWSEVLKVKEVKTDDNFFELGGDSLRAFQVLSRVREQLQVELPLGSLFEHAITPAGMAEAAEKLKSAVSSSTLPPVTPTPRNQKLLLSFPQQRIWLLDQLESGTAVYNVTRGLWLKGGISQPVLERSINEIIQRHEIFRTVFDLEGAPVQKILPAVRIVVPIVDLRHIAAADREASARRLARKEAEARFDLKRGPLLRAKLFQFSHEESFLALCFHQIVIDGWSVGVFFKELAELYEKLACGQKPELAPIPIQYADVAMWQRQWLQGETVSAQLGYWKKQLAGDLPVLRWPSEGTAKTARAETELLVLPKEFVEALKKFNRAENATLFMTLVGAYQSLLRHYSGQEEILVGSAVSGRNRLETEKLIGFLVNTVVLRNRVDAEDTFHGLLGKVRATSLAAFANTDVPFERVVEELNQDRGHRTPLFRAWFSFMDSMADFQMGGMTARPVHVPPPEAQFDLSLFIIERPDEVNCFFEYKTDLFPAETIHRVIADYEKLLRAVIENPQAKLKEVFEQLSKDTTPPSKAEPRRAGQTIHALIEQQALRKPQNIAVTCAGRSLTYAELDSRANQLAHCLQKLGVGPETMVGICCERSVEMLVGILGILKAGGAYVPLDPSYPKDRLQHMLRETNAPVLITQEKLKAKLPESRARILCLDSDWTEIRREPATYLSTDVNPDNLAYVIFTSGSTGKPKGVLVTHRNLVHSTKARFAYYPEKVESYLLISSFSFDSSAAGIFWTLCAGGNLVLPKEGEQQDPLELVRLIEQQKASHFLGLPSLYNLLLQQSAPQKLASLRAVIVAGEPCSRDLVDRHAKSLPETTLYNEYGPTEGTVWATVAELKSGEKVTIGKAIPGAEVHILDENLQPVKNGDAGEIYIGGAGVARGYLNRGDLTAQRFIPDHFNDGEEAKLYRTGDLARFSADGNIEFLGRVDHQVKIRGYRIELEEIESALREHPSVREAVVVARDADESVEGLAKRLRELDEERSEALLSEIEKAAPPPMEKRFQRQAEFDLMVEFKKPDFIRPPREAQRNWLLNRALAEFADDLKQLDILAKRFVPGAEEKPLNYVQDVTQAALDEQDILEDWHIPLMRAMAGRVTETHGDVLEIGFGRGVSATMIQQCSVRSHTIIECNDYIIQKFFEPWKARHAGRDIRLLRGKWQDVIDQAGLFDGVFFQTYPLNEQEFVEYLARSATFAEHFFPVAAAHLRKGGIFTYLTHEIDSLSRRHQRLIFKHFSSVSLSVEPLQLPPDCRDLWWADSMVVIKAVK